MKAGANLSARNIFGETPLHNANHHTVAALVDAGADLNSRDLDGNTPLHSAAQFGSPEVVVALIKAGADGSLKDASGKTAFEDLNENSKVKGTEAYWMLNDAQFN
jgi:ankyrin repeat protein